MNAVPSLAPGVPPRAGAGSDSYAGADSRAGAEEAEEIDPVSAEMQAERGADLRAGAEEICDQLCAVVAGDFGLRVETASADDTAQKLAMLSNFVLDAARRALERAEAKAAELRDAHRVARIGTRRRDLVEGVLSMSEELHNLLGTDPHGFEPTPDAVLALLHPDDRAGAAAALARAASGEAIEHRARLLRPGGTHALPWVETYPERDGAGRAVALGVCQDVTERQAAAERIYELAHRDALTGLVDRALLHERLDAALARTRRAGGSLAALRLDLGGTWTGSGPSTT